MILCFAHKFKQTNLFKVGEGLVSLLRTGLSEGGEVGRGKKAEIDGAVLTLLRECEIQ